MRKSPIVTPRVRLAQHELVNALVEAIETSGLDRDRAAGNLSAVISDIWNEAERIVKAKPLQM